MSENVKNRKFNTPKNSERNCKISLDTSSSSSSISATVRVNPRAERSTVGARCCEDHPVNSNVVVHPSGGSKQWAQPPLGG